MKIDRYMKNLISDSSRSLKERVFIVLTLVSTFLCALALLGDILYREDKVEIIVLILTVISVPLITLIGVKTNRVNIATRIITYSVIIIIIPVVFFYSGGTEGAVIPWMIFAYLYIGLVLSGGWRIGALVLQTLIVTGCFVYGNYHPEIAAGHSDKMGRIDTFLSVIEVGYICFIMTWFQSLLYTQENNLTKEESKKVEELSRSQNRFFSNMSHEIRTPINSILGLNEVILRDPSASDSIKKDAENIQGAGRMLLSLINDILDFSKIEAGKMDIVPVNYDVAALISDVVNMVWHRAEEKGLKFNVEIDPSLPSELYGDEMRIRQILVNLLNNAVKYTKEGSVTLHVEREAREEDNIVLLMSVTDTGIGIKQDSIPYLFDAFKRVDEKRNSGIEGTGLGLSIVKQLVDLMEGRITVDSIYTQGSTFTVTIRQKVTRADAIGTIDIGSYDKEHSFREYSASFTAKDARILIVDDSIMNLTVEKRLLEGTGITVDTATGGLEALSMTRAERYDVILMDHLMPEMDGIECMQSIRKQVAGLNNRIPIIVLTANADSEERRMYDLVGFDGYLLKPVSGSQLEEMLLTHLPSSKVERLSGNDVSMARMNTSRDYSRKIPVLVTCAGTCDLPVSVMKKYQIETIPYIISSEGRTFYDGVEASGEELVKYIDEGEKFDCDAPSVEDYRSFFGSRLKYAHNIIYISGGANISGEYARACEAARSYDNVAVIDSKLCTTAVGFLMLIALRMSYRGERFEKIIKEIEKARKRIKCAFVLDSIYFFRKRGPVNDGIAAFMRALGVNLVIRYKNDGFASEKYIIGGFDRYYKKFIDHMIPPFSKPDDDIAVVVYSKLSQEQKDKIEAYIRKCCDFKKIVFQRTSAVLPIHMGTDAFALTFFAKGEYSYELGQMFEEEVFEEVKEVQKEKPAGKWYDDIPGIDPKTAIKNCGSEEMFQTVIKAFHESIETDREQITGFYDAVDWKNYTVKVHALKSTALLVGAKELAEEERALEMAGKRNDTDYIKENTAKTMEHLMILKADLDRVLADE